MIFLITRDQRDSLPDLLKAISEVAVFLNVEAAVADGRQPRLIVIDGMESDGPSLVPMAMQSFPGVPVVGDTASQSTAEAFIRKGCVRAFLKAVDRPTEMMKEIQKIMLG